MLDFLQPYYSWILAGHVIAMVAWMAGIFYLPRLYVYHVEGLATACSSTRNASFCAPS
jgi:putative membrane protein